MDKCIYIDENEHSCGAFHTKDSEYCFRHDPAKKALALVASQKGGENRKLQSKFGDEIAIQNPSDVTAFLSAVINKVGLVRYLYK